MVCICTKLTKHIYFVAYLVVGFHLHLHRSSFNINTNIQMKGECKTVPSLCKRGGGIFINKILLLFWLLLQYSWSEILNLIKIIHVPQSITMRVTLLASCVPPYFGLAYCIPFSNTTTIFGNFIYIKKLKWQYVACTCTIILANANFCVFAC